MNIYNYDILNYIGKNGYINQRSLAEETGYSLGRVNESVRALIDKGYLDRQFSLTKKSLEEIQAGKPRNAIILAAGFGMRMVPINNEVPKGLLKVYGETIIERLIKQLNEVGVYDIHIVVGFLKEKFEYLIDKYGVNLIYNPDYALKNNLHSLKLVANKISNSYILPSDIWSKNNPFSDRELYSWYIVNDKPHRESNIRINRRRELVATKKGGGNRMIGISYFTDEDGKKLRKNIEDLAKNDMGDNSFWEEALIDTREKIKVYGREYPSDEIFEINTYEQLRELDDNSSSLETKILDLIAKEMDIQVEDIHDIEVLKKGMTNRSFIFRVGDNKYIMRIPGEGTDKLISRKNEYDVYEAIRDIHISDDVVYMSKENGYKITRYIENSRVCDPFNFEDVKKCIEKLKDFHGKKLRVNHSFDIFERMEFYEDLWEGKASIFDDYRETKEKVLDLKELIDSIPKDWILTHIDAVPDNFLMTDEDIHLIDWEYSSMQDPHLDIAMFAIYSLYNREEVEKLIDIYFDGQCENLTRLKIYAYIGVAGLLWSNWCEYKRFCGVEFGEYSLRQYRYAKEYHRLVYKELEKINNIN